MKKSKAYRNMKIHETSGYNYKATPAIVLKGQWLRELGFDIGGYVYISDKLTILHGQSDHLSRRFRSLISERYGR